MAEDILRRKIDERKALLEHWRKPSEVLLFETLRGIDYEHCRELLFPESTASTDKIPLHYLLSWGVNGALQRILPTNLASEPFRLFPSNARTQAEADEFVLQCGILGRAELLLGWLTAGLVSASVDHRSAGISSVLSKLR